MLPKLLSQKDARNLNIMYYYLYVPDDNNEEEEPDNVSDFGKRLKSRGTYRKPLNKLATTGTLHSQSFVYCFQQEFNLI